MQDGPDGISPNVGLDTHKARICVAVAEGGRGGGWVFENRSEILCKLAARLSRGG